MKYVPYNKRILCKKVNTEVQSVSGIDLSAAESLKSQHVQMFVVVRVGPDSGSKVLEEDKIVAGKYAGVPVDDQFTLLTDDEILAWVE
jgi:co-chaperonin GroES (HSP10)